MFKAPMLLFDMTKEVNMRDGYFSGNFVKFAYLLSQWAPVIKLTFKQKFFTNYPLYGLSVKLNYDERYFTPLSTMGHIEV